MCKFSSKSGGGPFQISFFLGDLTRNDPCVVLYYLDIVVLCAIYYSYVMKGPQWK